MGPYQSRPLKANTETSLPSPKTIFIITPGKKLSLVLTDASEPISKLISKLNQNNPSRYPIISLKTLDERENLDYWLSLPEKDLTPLEDSSELIAIFYSPVPAKICCSTFEFIKVLGKGAYSIVTLVRKKDTGILYAMKSIEKQRVLQEITVNQILSEKIILSSIDHPFICKMFWAFQSRKKLHIVMEYYPGGELYHHLKRVKKFSEDHAKFYFAEVLMSLKYLHEKDIAYRDLKPENIVIDIDGHVRLTDFGLSKMDMRDESRSFCGSPEYMSPDMLRNQGHTKMVDLYCIGVLLFELITGYPPFYDRNKNEMYLKILNSNLVVPDFVSDQAKDIILKLLDKNPKTRIGSLGGIEDVMRHPWLRDIDFAKLMEKKVQPPFVPDLHGSNIGPGYNAMKVNQEFFSDTEPEPGDQFSQFDYNSLPDSSRISKFYFEQKTRKYSEPGFKTPRTSLTSISGILKKGSSIFSLSPHLSPSISINFSNESSKEFEKGLVKSKLIGQIIEKSEVLMKIPELSPQKSTNPSFSSSKCNNTN